MIGPLHGQYSLQTECFLPKNICCNNCAKRLLFVQAVKIKRDLVLTYILERERSDFFWKFRIKIISGEDYWGNNVPESRVRNLSIFQCGCLPVEALAQAGAPSGY